jgi:rod shape-determining protein MreC
MSQLFGILYKLRNLFLFIFLQIISFYLIGKNNLYWDVTFFNTTNTMVAKSLQVSANVKEFMSLGSVNDQLAKENIKLRTELTKSQELLALNQTGYKPDSAQASRYDYTVAKVISNTVNLTDNYITIDKGTADGVKAGMGVICPQGVVGQVMSCGEHYSRVYSILHSSFTISSEVQNRKLRANNQTALGIGKWNGNSPKMIKLTTIDRFKPIYKNDTVLTSMQNAIFPPKIMVGKISKISSISSEAFFNIDVKLSTDFNNLVYVYIVNNKLLDQQKAVEVENPIQ